MISNVADSLRARQSAQTRCPDLSRPGHGGRLGLADLNLRFWDRLGPADLLAPGARQLAGQMYTLP